jgi:hypothetical protein
MPSEIYVDVPNDYPYEFGRYESGPQVLTRDFGVNFTFICNMGAKLSEGDVHRVEFKDEAEELIFFLKAPFKQLNKDVVERYIDSQIPRWRPKDETSYRSPRR